jgi:hypothetical protein
MSRAHLDERPTNEPRPEIARPSAGDRLRTALLRVQAETVAPTGKKRAAVIGVGSLVALTVVVSGAGATHGSIPAFLADPCICGGSGGLCCIGCCSRG